jgi:hypothetical protein
MDVTLINPFLFGDSARAKLRKRTLNGTCLLHTARNGDNDNILTAIEKIFMEIQGSITTRDSL